MIKYELTVILPVDIKEEDKRLVRSIIEDGELNCVSEEDEGEKTLAYSIQGHERGRYVYYTLMPIHGHTPRPRLIEERLHQESRALRFLLVNRIINEEDLNN